MILILIAIPIALIATFLRTKITGMILVYTRTPIRSNRNDTICGSIQYLITELKTNKLWLINHTHYIK